MSGQEQDVAAEIKALEAELASLEAEKTAAAKRVRELMDAEDPRAGVCYAQEIFAAKQEKLTLETRHEIARRRRNRLLQGM
jgi:hypothetical protein